MSRPPAGTAGQSVRDGAQDPLPDQVLRVESQAAGRYVRFRMHVEEGVMSIIDSHLVESPLVMPPTLHGNYAYEVTDGTRLLHADTIPDLGVVRSFSNPSGTREQLRHHTYRLSNYDFDVRVPAQELTAETLSKISVVLYRVKERAPTRPLTTAAPLSTQFEREFREVTRVESIPYEALPSAMRGISPATSS